MKALFWKELGYYFKNPIGYIVIGLFAVFVNFLYVKDLFVIGTASMRGFFELVPWLYLIFIPAISMRSLSEEKRSNTLETLLSLPISEIQIVLAKFFALVCVVTVALLLTLSLPVSLSIVSTLYLPEIITGYLGAIVLAALFISISMFFSSLTKNQVVAFLASTLVLFIAIVFSSEFAAGIVPRDIIDFYLTYAPTMQYTTFVKGVLDLRTIFYFLSFTTLFIGLTSINIEKRD